MAGRFVEHFVSRKVHTDPCLTFAVVTKSYVLPIVTALNGEPQVTDDGDIVYIFPELQTSAMTTQKSTSAVSIEARKEALLLKRAGLKSTASIR